MLPVQVLDLSCLDATQVLLFREHPAQRVDQLRVFGVQLFCSINISGDQRTESITLGRAKEFRLPAPTSGVFSFTVNRMSETRRQMRVGRVRSVLSDLRIRDLRVLLGRDLPLTGPMAPHVDKAELAAKILLLTCVSQLGLAPNTGVARDDSHRRSKHSDP